MGDNDLVPEALSSDVRDSVMLLELVSDGESDVVGDAESSDVGLPKVMVGEKEKVGSFENVAELDLDALSVIENDLLSDMSSEIDFVVEGIMLSLSVGLTECEGEIVLDDVSS